MQKRSVAAVIVFSILTCGIYFLYWTYVTADAYQRTSGRSLIPPVLTTLLMLFFEPAGGALLGLDADESINAIKMRYGMPTEDNRVVWLLIGIFLPIVTAALVQNEINHMIDAMHGGSRNGGWSNGSPNTGWNHGNPNNGWNGGNPNGGWNNGNPNGGNPNGGWNNGNPNGGNPSNGWNGGNPGGN